jgi:hypothetical protein
MQGHALPDRQRRTRKFHTMMDDDTYTRLIQMASAENVAAAVVVRAAITLRWLHTIQGTPMCAGGSRCLVPHLHASPPASPQAITARPNNSPPTIPPPNQQEPPR